MDEQDTLSVQRLRNNPFECEYIIWLREMGFEIPLQCAHKKMFCAIVDSLEDNETNKESTF